MPYDVSHIPLHKYSGLDGSSLIETHLEGSTKIFENFIVPTAPGFLSTYGNRQAQFQLARNVSGSTLLPGRFVSWSAGYRGRRFDAYSYQSGTKPGGVVSPFLNSSTGVPANGLCWIQQTGICPCKTPTVTAAFGGSIVEGDPLYILPASGATNSVAGRVTRFGNQLLYVATAESAEHENTTDAADFDKSVTLPAYFLQVGDVLRIRAQVNVVDNNSTDTLTLLLTIGGATIITSGAVDVADADVGYFDCDLVVRAVGAASTAVFQAAGVVALGVQGTVTAKPFMKALTTVVDTTAAQKIAVNADWSVAHADNEASLSLLNVTLQRANAPVSVGRAYEAKADTATDADVLVDLDLAA